MYKYIIISILWIGISMQMYGFNNGRAGFSITVNNEVNPYEVFSIFVMPGSSIRINCEQELKLSSSHISIPAKSGKSWDLKSPAKRGTYSMVLEDNEGRSMKLNILVMTPITEKKGEYLYGYRIGNYPSTPLRGNPIYNRPKGLFEVNKDNIDLRLSPHFTLRQFLCKQAGDFPKYVIIRERLLLKLEYLLAKVNDAGYESETFGFISGYRTPFYNKSIKNVQYSRHVYGGAADIFIDQNSDGSMDDMNGDGKTDEKDVRNFYNLVDEEFDKSSYDKFKGGLGFYRNNSRHNGFIHVDVRGWKARW